MGEQNGKVCQPVDPDEDNKEVQGIIDEFRHRSYALRTLAKTQLKHASENQDREVQAITKKNGDAFKTVQSGANAREFGYALNTWLDSNKTLEILKSFPQEEMLAETIFTAIFSGFEAYLGKLLLKLFLIRPELLKSNRNVRFSDVLSRKRDDIVRDVIDSEIDSLLRQSYSKCFDRIAKKFNVGTLKQFRSWSKFIECAQRRNVITHCGGIASRQYVEVCKSENVDLGKIEAGDRLAITNEYLYEAVEVVAEVGLKLGQVLWRAISDPNLDFVDAHLGNLIFDLLKSQDWELAKRMGEFGHDCSKRSYEKPRNDRCVKIILLNHAQAEKWSGNDEDARKIVDAVDWSASGPEFRLAVACLKDDIDAAVGLMQEIGRNSDKIPLHAYHGWPIFRKIRIEVKFSATFKEIFGVEFIEDLADESNQAGDDGTVDPPI